MNLPGRTNLRSTGETYSSGATTVQVTGTGTSQDIMVAALAIVVVLLAFAVVVMKLRGTSKAQGAPEAQDEPEKTERQSIKKVNIQTPRDQ